MAETQKRRSPVVVAVLVFLLSSAVFAGAVYALDGVGFVTGLMSDLMSGDAGTPPPVGSTEATGLVLPQGVTEEFALRLWQEQVDSQRNIRHLVDGDLKELKFAAPTGGTYDGKLGIEVRFADGTRSKGDLYLTQKGRNWYVDHISGLGPLEEGGMAGDTGRTTEYPATPLPKLADVDVGVLNTIFAEQEESQDVFADYLSGNVERIVIDSVKKGPGTATVLATMHEKEHTVEAQIVLITTEFRGKELWFLTKFVKLKTVPKT